MRYKVCIIVLIYNVERYIERCACSLFEQTFDDIQYIFVNDCTLDNSITILKKVIEKFPQKEKNVFIVEHKKNEGSGIARVTGLVSVNADFVLYVDGDDFIAPNTVELMYSKAIDENADIVVCDFLLNWGKVTKATTEKYDSDNEQYVQLLLSTQAQPGLPNKLIKYSLYKQNNITFAKNINMGEDFAVTPRLAYYAKKIAKVDLPLYNYNRCNANSYTKTYSYSSAISLMKAIQVLEDFFIATPERDFYYESLLQGKLKKKILLLMELDNKNRRKIAKIFLETNIIIPKTKLTIIEKLIILLNNKRLFLLLDMFLFVYKNLIELIQILKGRRKKCS